MFELFPKLLLMWSSRLPSPCQADAQDVQIRSTCLGARGLQIAGGELLLGSRSSSSPSCC